MRFFSITNIQANHKQPAKTPTGSSLNSQILIPRCITFKKVKKSSVDRIKFVTRQRNTAIASFLNSVQNIRSHKTAMEIQLSR